MKDIKCGPVVEGDCVACVFVSWREVWVRKGLLEERGHRSLSCMTVL